MGIEAVVAGHICLDIIPTLPQGADTFQPGRLVEVGRAVVSTGGAVSNTGLALHTLGVKVRLMGKVGDDAFGGIVRCHLEAKGAGLGQGLSITEGDMTSYTVVLSPPGSDRMFLHAPGCNDTFSAGDLDPEVLGQARLMHFGYPPLMRRMYENEGRELERLLRAAREAGCTTSLDLSFPDLHADAGRADWRAILKRALPLVDLFSPNVEELLFMLRRSDCDRLVAEGEVVEQLREESIFGLAQESLDMGAQVVALKAGRRGLFLKSRPTLAVQGRAAPEDPALWSGVRHREPCYRVEVAGTTGAGDATVAGLLMAWLRGLGPLEAAQAATAVGACCCEQPDAVRGVRGWDETARRIRSGWAKLEP